VEVDRWPSVAPNLADSGRAMDGLNVGRWKVEGARWKRGLKPRSKPYGDGDAAE
jgi:hypothetical protein